MKNSCFAIALLIAISGCASLGRTQGDPCVVPDKPGSKSNEDLRKDHAFCSSVTMTANQFLGCMEREGYHLAECDLTSGTVLKDNFAEEQKGSE